MMEEEKIFNYEEPVKEVKKPVKKTNKNKSHVGIVLLMSILLSFVCGMLGAYFISQTVSVEQVVATPET